MAKALTIKQPYASLIVEGIKDIENRTWKTNYRGRILIHAGKDNLIKNLKYGDEITCLNNKQLEYITNNKHNDIFNKELITGGFEQLRFDYDNKNINKFPPKYFYSMGRNYFVNIAFRF